MALEENEADLALWLLNHLIEHSPRDKTVIVAGGFAEAMTVKSSNPGRDVSTLEADRKEGHASNSALHPLQCGINGRVSSGHRRSCALSAHYDKMGCTNLFMKAGISSLNHVVSVVMFFVSNCALTGVNHSCDPLSQNGGSLNQTAATDETG